MCQYYEFNSLFYHPMERFSQKKNKEEEEEGKRALETLGSVINHVAYGWNELTVQSSELSYFEM